MFSIHWRAIFYTMWVPISFSEVFQTDSSIVGSCCY
jgi:hypothetical protein